MFESLEIRQVRNGFTLTIHQEDGSEDYIFTTLSKLQKFIRNCLDTTKPIGETK